MKHRTPWVSKCNLKVLLKMTHSINDCDKSVPHTAYTHGCIFTVHRASVFNGWWIPCVSISVQYLLECLPEFPAQYQPFLLFEFISSRPRKETFCSYSYKPPSPWFIIAEIQKGDALWWYSNVFSASPIFIAVFSYSSSPTKIMIFLIVQLRTRCMPKGPTVSLTRRKIPEQERSKLTFS